MFSTHAPSQAMREALLSIVRTPTSREQLDNEDDILGGRLSTHRFHFVETCGTQGIKTHTVLCLFNVFCQLRFEQHELFLGEKTFEKGVLRPGAEA